MNRTLREYLQQADATHEYLEQFCAGLSNGQIEEKIVELQSSIKTIQTVAYQLANISNIATRVLHRRQKTAVVVDPYPDARNVGTLRTLNPVETIQVCKEISIPTKLVNSIEEIPVSHMYFVKNLGQFAINIEGIVIRGNLGNIVDYQCSNSVKCEYGIECKSFAKKKPCGYYHDPEDFIHHKLPLPNTLRNFTVGSWIYSKTKSPKTYFTRHMGSADRIIYDLNTLKRVQYREEISNREGQLVHDLLIYLILNSRGLLEKYLPWKHMPKNT